MKKKDLKDNPKKKPQKSADHPKRSEQELFLDLMDQAGIRPLSKSKKKAGADLTLQPIPIGQEVESLGVIDRNGLQETNEAPHSSRFHKKIIVKKGFEPDDIIDLHGETQQSAMEKLKPFIRAAIRDRLRHVLVITGKGLNSTEEGGVLNKVVWAWLEFQNYKKIKEYQEAPSFLGGSGAILIFFR